MEIDGFKSFAHKTVIKFQPGMTGIIGPNGSGKSNIIEAIRWVMGEQSAKTLRGGKMVDVIFNGSTGHQKLNRAVVKMTLDNSDHYLQSDYTTITVTRKLYRNGDSEYLINDHHVRLKDIVDLFIDSGIGRESFSVISQGQVAQVFNGHPTDRRKIIETVAGVAKYKQNKATAEKKLEETAERLDRVNDIVLELEGRLDPLKEASSLAEDYLEQKKRLDLFDRTQTVRRIHSDQDKLATIRKKITSSQTMSQNYDQQLKSAKDKTQAFQQQRKKVLADKDNAQSTQTVKVEEIAKLQNQQSLASIRKEQRQKDQKRLQQQQTEIVNQRAQLDSSLAKNQQQQDQLKQSIKDAKKQLVEAQKMSPAQLSAKLQKQLEQSRNDQVELLQQLTTIHNQRVYLKQNHERSINVAKHDQESLLDAQQKLEKVSNELGADQEKFDSTRQQYEQIQQQLQAEEDHQAKLQSQYDQKQKAWYQALGNVQSGQRQLKNYQAMMADYTGYYLGVQNVLKNRQQFPGLAGAVSELIKVPDKYTVAIETVLGGQLQQLVVDTQNTGKQILRFLSKTRGGRVTVLPLDSIRAGWQPSTMHSVASMRGFIGAAVDLIDYPQQFSKVIEHLLSTTVVVDNLDNATMISRAGHHQLRVITLDGQLINASGAMTGGASRHQRIGLLSQKQQLVNLQNNLQKEQDTASRLENQVRELKTAREANQSTYQELQQRVVNQRGLVNQLTTNIQLRKKNQEELKRQVQALEFQASQTKNQHGEFQAQVQANEKEEEQVNNQLAQSRQKVADLKERLADLQNNASAQEETIHNISQSIAVDQEKMKQAAQRKTELKKQNQELEAQLEQIADQLKNLKLESNEDDTNHLDSKSAIKQAQKELTDAKQVIESCNQKQEQLEEELGDLEQENERLQGLSRAVLNDLSTLNDQKGRLETEIDQDLNNLNEAYHMTLLDAEKNQSDLDDDQLARQIKLLKRGLDDLGNVNLGAIDEYREVSKRYEFLSSQKNDLLAARDQLKQTMNKMDNTVKERFQKTFNQVSVSFAETFQQIFNGGHAKLVLTDPDDLLNTGVNIMAQPPGKKNQQLSLLSGGEKALTAIALLFAILKVRPVPFAILDEPEAALDDVNVDRFANYLDRFGNSGPQFIVITHRKGTMRNADILYGVTMQESGISEVVSVDVNKTLNEESTNA